MSVPTLHQERKVKVAHCGSVKHAMKEDPSEELMIFQTETVLLKGTNPVTGIVFEHVANTSSSAVLL